MLFEGPILARNESPRTWLYNYGCPSHLSCGQRVNAKSKPGSWSCAMLDRDSFMIHSVNSYFVHSAGTMLGTLSMLADWISPTTLKLLITPINRCRNCDSEGWSNLPKVIWLIGSKRKTACRSPCCVHQAILPSPGGEQEVTCLWTQSEWHVTATICHLLAVFEATLSCLLDLMLSFHICEMRTLY